MWCIPPEQDAAFVAAMEQVLAVYHRPYDVRFPVVCMDEQPIQLVSHSRKPLPMRPGSTTKVDYCYLLIEGLLVVSIRLPRCDPAYVEINPLFVCILEKNTRGCLECRIVSVLRVK